MTKLAVVFLIGLMAGAALVAAQPSGRSDFISQCQKAGGSPYGCGQEWDRFGGGVLLGRYRK
jgi:hypothetical protein